MAVYFVTGKLGCGKTLCTVGKIRDYLEQGRRVATNLDINLAAMTKPESMVSITRVPDKPALYDLEAIGMGCEEEEESKYGLLVLDELGTWFNSRNWRDKGRGDVIDWFLHARKKHWDIFFIVQNLDSLDGQLVNALCEHLVVCARTDRLKIPFIGSALKTLGVQAMLPKIHIAKVYYGQNASAMAVDRWWYRGRDLYSAYNTAQIFDDESHAVHSVLPAYYTNNIKLISEHEGKIKALKQPDLRPKAPPASMKTTAVILFSFFVLAVSYRTYAKFTEIKSPAQLSLENPGLMSDNKPITLNPVSVPVSVPAVFAPPVVDDYIKSITQGALVSASSYYSANGSIKAILHVSKDEGVTSTFTLDDARASGYVVLLHGNVVEVKRGGYYFTFRTQNNISG